MKLVLITSSDIREAEVSNLTQILEMGLPTLHLRKPKISTNEMRKLIASIPTHFHNRIVIHSHHSLAREFDLKGIHITRLHRKRWIRGQWNDFLFRLKGKKPQRTCSFRKLSSLYEASEPYDYVFLSPIFDSLSGTLQGGFNEFSLRAALEKTSYRVIARGGIEANRMEKVQELGFAGLALYSAIWRKKDPVAAFEHLLKTARERSISFT